MEALMKRIVAALTVAMMAVHTAPAFAETRERKPEPMRQDGPLLRASLRPNIPPPSRTEARQASQAAKRDDRSWVERHPVWTGAMVGFGATAAMIYLSTDPGGIPGRETAVLVWGGVGAGIGALAGWGIGRSQDDE
jgi:hypothetical protein